MTESGASVAPTADVDSDAFVGPGTAIGAGTRVRHGARLGGGVIVGRDVLIDQNVVVGDGSTVHDRVLVYSGTTIGDGVFVGPGAILTNERYPRAVTTTADTAAPPPEGGVTLDTGSTIGAGVVVVAGVEVGRYALVGAGAVVTANVPAHALVAGNPAHRLGWVCECGRRLVDAHGDPAPAEPAQYSLDTGLTCPACGRVYQYVPDAETLEERSGPHQGLPA